MENTNYNNNFINFQEMQSERVAASVVEHNIEFLEQHDFEHENEQEQGQGQGHSYRVKWTNEMKVKLVIIDSEERNKGRSFMSRVEQRWNAAYPMFKMTSQKLRDNAARFKRESEVMNLISVKYSK